MTDEELAKKRFTGLMWTRVAGVIMFVLGALVVTGKLDWNIWIGYFLLLNGLLDALFMSAIMKAVWKRQDAQKDGMP